MLCEQDGTISVGCRTPRGVAGRTLRIALLAAAAIALLSLPEPSHAQVTVDPSALETPSLGVGKQEPRLAPPDVAPRSRLLVPAPEGVTIPEVARVPEVRTPKKAPAPAKTPVAAPKPEPLPALPEPPPAPVIAAPEPAPEPATLAETPAPEPAEEPMAVVEPLPEPEPIPEPQIAEPEPEPMPEPVAEPEAVVEAAPEPAPEPVVTPPASEQTAALPPSNEIAPGQVRIAFPEGSTDIPAEAIPELDALAASLLADEGSRIQLLAYASGGEDAASRARRISLSRALAVRSYLIGKGVRSTRMDVRALGNTVPGEPADRVDIIPQS